MTQSAPQNFDVRAPAMSIVNLVTGEERSAQFNPEELKEALGANYARLVVPGLSHTRKHFINTEDTKYSFELFQHALGSGDTSEASLLAILEDRRFLMSLLYPWRSNSINKGGAPRVLFVWPRFISLECTVLNVEFRYTVFNRNNVPVAWRCAVTVESIRDEFFSMEDMRSRGTGPEDV